MGEEKVLSTGIRIFQTSRTETKKSVAAFTLVEVMVAIVIFAVLVVAAGAFIYMSQGSIAVQKNRRVAIEAANMRLEELRAAAYANICPLSENYSTYFIEKSGGSWVVSVGNPGETVSINGVNRPITTTVRYVDIEGDSPPDSYDCLRLAVSVAYGGGSDTVDMETLRSP